MMLCRMTCPLARVIFLLALFALAWPLPAEELPDIESVKPDLAVPPLETGQPAAGKRVRQVLPAYRETSVYHSVYLPTDWQSGQRYPVIVEYAGNGPYKNRYGDNSTGFVEGSKLGYGISSGEGFIWICLPYLNEEGTANVTKWWGDAPTFKPDATLAYCQATVPWICKQYGGDEKAVVLAGFSRGAIACNYLGLHNDQVAKLWRAFIPYSHYDGVREGWPYPGVKRPAALVRLRRLQGRPQFICHEQGSGQGSPLAVTRQYLGETGVKGTFTFQATGFRNHNDAWVLRPSPARTALRKWLTEILALNQSE